MAKIAYNVTIPTSDTIPILGIRGPYGPQAVYEEYLWEIIAGGFTVNFNVEDGTSVVMNRKDLIGFTSVRGALDAKGYTLPGDNYKIALKVVKTEEKKEEKVITPEPKKEEKVEDTKIDEKKEEITEPKKEEKVEEKNHHNGQGRRDKAAAKLDKAPESK